MKLYTTKVVASWLDMTERGVRELKKKKIITEYEGRSGLYQLKETVAAYINYLRNKNPDAATNLDYNEERALLVRTKRENAELDLRLRKNDLHETEDIEITMTDMLIRFRTKLMAIPAKQSPILAKKADQKEVFKILKAAIDEALEELADYDSTFGSGKEERENAETNS